MDILENGPPLKRRLASDAIDSSPISKRPKIQSNGASTNDGPILVDDSADGAIVIDD